MSIPKLKVYRLDTDFDESNDTDIQSQTKDELLPVSEKELNPLTAAEEMVGVKLRGDCRIVSRQPVQYRYAGIDESSGMRTVPVPCEGWIMGKANIDVAVLNAAGNGWHVLDKRLWDYDVSEVRQYLVGGVYQDAADQSATLVANISHITIRFGAMMENTNLAKSSGNPLYSSSWNASGGQVRISYHPYLEWDQSEKDPSTRSAPFSDIYNGNPDGRTIHYVRTGGTNAESGRSVPDGAAVSRTRMNRFEGNYLYRRRIFPLRVMPVGLSDGSGTVDATFNWYADGMMAPVFMQRVPVPFDDGSSSSGGESSSGPDRWVYKRLEEGSQFTKIYDMSGESPSYTVTLNRSYYRLSEDLYCYPGTIYVFYNFMDDDMGEPFDFDFAYSLHGTAGDTLPGGISQSIYGFFENSLSHGNSGSLDPHYGMAWSGLRQEFLAVRDGRGYDGGRGDALLEDAPGSDAVRFTMPRSFTRNGVSGYTVSAYHEIRIYHDGNLVCEIPPWFIPLDASSSSESSSVSTGYSVEMSGDVVTVAHPSGITVNDLMVACIVDPPAGGDIAGWRVPCYERARKATLFVSSFPNWLKGHLNNDLDVFVGYQQYSGVNTADEQIDSVYPKYVKDGWHPMYPEGALQFTEPVEQYDYYDVFNFGVLSEAVAIPSDKASQIWTEVEGKLLPNYCPTNGSLGNYRIYCSRVMCNVARHEALYQVVRGRMSNISVQGGVSTYKLLTDDSFSEAYGRRWTYRHDNYVRRMYSAGQEELPRVIDSSEDGHERPPAVSTESVERGTLVESETPTIVRANLSSGRAMFIRYVLTGSPVAQNGFIVCLNSSSGLYSREVFGGLADDDVRIHVKIVGRVLNVGPETSQAPVANVDAATVFTQPVSLVPLPDRPDEVIPDIDADVDLDVVQDAAGDGNGRLYRYTYTGFPEFDVCFEPFSYHYTNAANPGDRQVRSVEFMVYKTDKS